MPTDHRTELKKIRTFPQLVRYLRDEMGWPIEQDSFEDDEDLYYEFTPEELGLDTTTSAKIEQIRRLRRLSANQPWGIFFVKFAPGRLPVIALRRILNLVVVKKRASARAAERTAWAADDLLFVSNYGEGNERQISFAHFSQSETKHDIPTLKVLGWDNRDTALHLDDVARELTTHLAWPDDPDDEAAWRKRWRAAFTLGHREVVTTSKELSIRLAELARAIRDRIKTALAIETDKGQLTRLMKAFQTALVHDLDADGFADMYAQTIAYGLLSARIADPHKKTADDFAAHMRTNPFLRELMEIFLKVGGRSGKAGGPGIDFDELGVSEVVELLDDANMEAVVRDFGDKNPQEDPVIHFYELFLKEYDAKKRMQRGVFYTPRPVVSYIVRSVDELLRTEFGLVDGLADTTTWGEMAKRHKDLKIPEGVSSDQDFVQILDPATGTGTFLVEVIDLIHKTLVAKWKAQGHGQKKLDALWNEYVPKHLLTRLHGYELLMAPYAIAHLKIGLKLYETGYRFDSDERARVYLTNALEPASEIGQQTLEGFLPALAHEVEAVNEVKRKQAFTVVIGNPPYAYKSANSGEHITALLRKYYSIRGFPLLEKNPKGLQDDYVKFFRLGEHILEHTRAGFLGFITNHGYIDNPTFRAMRYSLGTSAKKIYIFDLHGNAKKTGLLDCSIKDENVFEIQQGVAIGLFLFKNAEENRGQLALHYSQIVGLRSEKYDYLSSQCARHTKWIEINALPDFYLFCPHDTHYKEEYELNCKISDVFISHSVGIQTGRDALTIGWAKDDLKHTLSEFVRLQPEVARGKFNLGKDSRDWKIALAQADLKRTSLNAKNFAPIAYRPFDTRITYYTGKAKGIHMNPRSDVMDNLIGKENVVLYTCRQTSVANWSHVFICSSISDDCYISNNTSERGYAHPLYLYANMEELAYDEGKKPNFTEKFLNHLASVLRLKQSTPYGLPREITPETILHYIYAVFHSPGYRSRYAEFLKIDFPRLPLTGNMELFRALARLGGELVALHLLESLKVDLFITEYIGGRAPEVEKVSWTNGTVWLDKMQTTGFKGVREEVWNFHIGGYQVCHKWLDDRRKAGRTLSKDDIAHYQKIVVALSETIRLMKEIDEVIEQHGGWPDAFSR